MHYYIRIHRLLPAEETPQTIIGRNKQTNKQTYA